MNPEDTRSKPKHAVGRPARFAIGVIVFGLLAHFILIPLLGDFSSTWAKVRAIDVPTMIVAAVIEIVVWGLYGYTYRLLMTPENRPASWVCASTAIAAKGISHVLPAGAATTAAVDYKVLHQAGVPNDELVFSFGGAGSMTAVSLNVMLAISLVFSIPRGDNASIVAPLLSGLALVVGLSVLVWALVRRPHIVGRFAGRLLGWIPGVSVDSVESAIVGFGHKIRTLMANPRLMVTLGVISVVKWVLGALALWIVLQAVGNSPGVFEVFVAFALANVSAAIPLTPGGLGVFEAVMISTLVAYGMPNTEAAAGVLAFRLLNFWMPIPLGGLAYVLVDQATKRGMGVTPALHRQLAT